MTHTPKPWLVSVSGSFKTEVRASTGRRVASTWVQNPVKSREAYLNQAKVNEANARLIAAAPELLQALKDLIHAYEEPDRRVCCDRRDCGCFGSTVHEMARHYARDAIAKAEGREIING